jgi:cellulose 1,4-beta-cellobiosidase
VQFLDGSTALGTVTISGGKAALSLSTLSVGSHSIKAVYGGDSNYLTGTSAAVTQSVTGAACHVTYGVTNQWSSGFGTAITIQNTGTTAVNGWNLTWTWAGNQKITQSWASSYSQTGANAKLTNAGYNGAIAAGATISGIGFNASYSGTNTNPTAFSLNGTLCK